MKSAVDISQGRHWFGRACFAPLFWGGLLLGLAPAQTQTPQALAAAPPGEVVAEPAPVRVGNLIYARLQTGRCFSDEFLRRVPVESSVRTTGKLHPVRLGDDDLRGYPLLILAGDRAFQLTAQERDRLRDYLERDGFLLVSAGCASIAFDRAFRRELAVLFPRQILEPLAMDHPVFHTIHDITSLRTSGGSGRPLLGMRLEGRLALIYSPDGLHDTDRVADCCCCGGQELLNASDINLNILAYVLAF